MMSYNIREGKMEEFQKFLASEGAHKMFLDVEKKTGIKYDGTYFRIVPFARGHGDYDCQDWWEMPNHAALDKVRETNAFADLLRATYAMTEPNPNDSSYWRKAEETKVMWEPKAKK